MKLRPYQSDGIERLRRGFLRVRKQLFVAPTGAGKTVLAAHLTTSAVLKSTRVWFIAHRTELIKQGFQKFARYGVPVDRIGIIMAGTKLPEIGYVPPAELPADENELYAKHARRRPLAPCQVASIDTLRNRLKDLEPAKTREEADGRGDPQVVIIDECFPAGTMIGDRAIETIRVGDYVDSFNHVSNRVEKRVVTDAWSSLAIGLVVVKTTDGTRIECTHNHPFYVAGVGYVAAGELKYGQTLLVLRDPGFSEALGGTCTHGQRLLRPIVHEGRASEATPYEEVRDVRRRRDGGSACQEGCGSTDILQRPLREGVERQGAQEGGRVARLVQLAVCFGPDEGKQPHARSVDQGEDERVTPCDRPCPTATRWEREADASCAASDHERPLGNQSGVGARVHLPDAQEEALGVPVPLQARRGARCNQDVRGGGRAVSHVTGETARRCEARRDPSFARVDSVEILKSPSDDGSGGVRVYNFSVDGNENYFANGILVHNCHRSLSPSYVRLFELFPFALFVGLTATPYRADGRGLGALYEDMVVVAQPSELITIGAILEPRVFTVPAKDLPNLASVKIKGGDYDPTQLTAAVDQKGLVGNIVENWQRRAQGRSTVVFAASVEHSKHIRDRFVEAGIKAEHVDGTTPVDEREAILARVASGETLVLCNMGVATEGYDCPRVKCCVLARPTKSLGLTIQMAGRILRPWVDAFGNTVEPIILDHAGCILEHGFPTTDREFDLDDKPKRASKKNDAPVKVCEECFAIVAAASPTCTVCGWEFPAKEKVAFEEAEGELVEVTKVSLDDKKQRYAELLKEAERTGRKPGWAYYRYKEQFNEEPPKGVKPAAAPKLDASDEEMKAAWEVLVEECRDRGYKPAWVGVRFKAMFGRDVPSGFLIDALKASVAPYEPTSEWGF